jgi:hypothetical protein
VVGQLFMELLLLEVLGKILIRRVVRKHIKLIQKTQKTHQKMGFILEKQVAQILLKKMLIKGIEVTT